MTYRYKILSLSRTQPSEEETKSQDTPEQNRKNNKLISTNVLDEGVDEMNKLKFFMDLAKFTDDIRWKHIHVFSIFTAGLIASLFTPKPNVILSGTTGIIISLFFVYLILRTNAYHRYYLETMDQFIQASKYSFLKLFKRKDIETSFKWYENIFRTRYLLFLFPFIFVLFWVLVMILSMEKREIQWFP